jgi:hypothetical protein
VNGRINILLVFTFFFGSLAFFELTVGGSFFFTIVTLLGLAAIAFTLWTHVRFKLVFDTLIIEQPFRSAFSVDLNKLVRWRALSYYIRGQHRKTLVLILNDEKKLILTNTDYQPEFKELADYLRLHYRVLEKTKT